MFLNRNQPDQEFVLPGSLRFVADGSDVTSGASLTIVKDGNAIPASGILTHISGGAYSYVPTQSETDCDILGFVLTAPGAITVCGSLRTIFSVDLGSVLGQPVNLQEGYLDTNVVQIAGQPATATGPVTFPLEAALPEVLLRLQVDDQGRVRVQPVQIQLVGE